VPLPNAMSPITEISRYIKGDVKGCPDEIVLQETVAACGEFCKKTQIWRVEGEPIPVQAAVHTYATPAPETTLPETIREAAFRAPNQTAYRPITPVTEGQLMEGGGAIPYHQGFFGIGTVTDWKGRTGSPRWVLHEFDPAFFRLVPNPTATDAGGLIRVTVAVWPSHKATQIPTWILTRYHEGLAMGALARLYAMKGEYWTDEARAERNLLDFNEAMGEATNKVQKNFTRARLRVEPRERFA